ncbi:MAG TPA: glutathione S-transferase [Steroidobacteraceae bacterium]|nr:glutathione S-transferase [Steroidobacteraceae bacterium]
MYQLYIANKNYSSWSLRPWVLMSELQIGFQERMTPFGDEAAWQALRRLFPSGKVPCLQDDELRVWDSLAILEYLAERHTGVWPRESAARAWARSAAAEMHSGFAALREHCSMSCGIRLRLRERPAALARDLERLTALWLEGLARFGGPFLAGERFCAVDACFAPVAFRVQTYGLDLAGAAAAYAQRLLQLRSMQAWYAAALAEPLREAAHETHVLAQGTLLQDLRVAPSAAPVQPAPA